MVKVNSSFLFNVYINNFVLEYIRLHVKKTRHKRGIEYVLSD